MRVALAGTIGFAVAGVVGALVIRAVVTKVVVLAVSGLLALFLWIQRDAISDCASRSARNEGGTCTFIGLEVKARGPAGA